jgi:hypothetical protein
MDKTSLLPGSCVGGLVAQVIRDGLAQCSQQVVLERAVRREGRKRWLIYAVHPSGVKEWQGVGTDLAGSEVENV